MLDFRRKHEYEALQLFKSAEAYRRASDILLERRRGLWIQRIVLLAFAAELYFKCLILITRKKSVRGHNLERLYGELSKTSQRRIRAEFDRLFKTVAYQDAKSWFFEAGLEGSWVKNFDTALRVSANAFERFRYNHEDVHRGTHWWAPPIMEGITKDIFVLRPEWKRHIEMSKPRSCKR